jgi:hypothetical protein
MSRIFLSVDDGRRPVHGVNQVFRDDPNLGESGPFYEYFHGETGAGVGARNQTGWTGLVAKLLQQSGEPNPRGQAASGEKPRIRVRDKAPQLGNVTGD